MTRTILTPSNNKNIYICLIPKSSKAILEKQTHYSLYKHVKFIYINTINDIEKYIKQIRPDFIIVTVDPNFRFNNFEIPTYYVHHGIFNHNKNYGQRVNWSGFKPTILCSDIFQYQHHTNKNVSCKKINGLPQFDLILHLKSKYLDMEKHFRTIKNIKPIQPIILIISSHQYQNQSGFYYKLYSALSNIFPNAHLIFKGKHQWNIKTSSKKNQNCTSLHNNDLIYNYFFADLIITHTYGTSYVESLLANPRSILFDPNYQFDAPILYKNMQAFTQGVGNILGNKYYDSDEYISGMEQYISNIIGTDKVELVSDKLLDLDF
jgi:hypothetical protein